MQTPEYVRMQVKGHDLAFKFIWYYGKNYIFWLLQIAKRNKPINQNQKNEKKISPFSFSSIIKFRTYGWWNYD